MRAEGEHRAEVEVVAAFVDGESVDPVQLDAALAGAEGRAYLIDLLVLRGLVDGHGVARPAASHAASPARWWSAAAAIAVVSVLGGYVAGQRTTLDRPEPPAGAFTTRPASSPDTPASASPIDAPEPTNVIQLQPGVDWQEQGSGS
jgi:hypothetical protein